MDSLCQSLSVIKTIIAMNKPLSLREGLFSRKSCFEDRETTLNCFATQLLKLNFSQEVKPAVALLVIVNVKSETFSLMTENLYVFPQKSMSLIKSLFVSHKI